MKYRRAAHFLLIPELLHSPPNYAIINAYIRNGYQVDIFTPGDLPKESTYGDSVRICSVDYSWLWIARNIVNKRWLDYHILSGTSEDPLGIVGLLARIYRRKSICLVDEIKTGSYRGDRSKYWKGMCIKAIKRSELNIVNDESRISLLHNYAGLSTNSKVIVYPGCFYQRPKMSENVREKQRRVWGFTNGDFVIGSSGGFNLTAGADWLITYIRQNKEVRSVIQPLGISPLCMFLLQNLDCRERIYIQEERMDWHEAWESAQGLDAGICIYLNQAEQFQNMGISSNRLCMFLAMGVPVIASRQESFRFLEDYGCGVLVSNYREFDDSVRYIQNNLSEMRMNCYKCFSEYIRPKERFDLLSKYVERIDARR